MTGGYTVTRGGVGMDRGYRVWDVDAAFYVGGMRGAVYATFGEAAAAAAAQEAADRVARVRAGTCKGPLATGRTYRR